MKTRSYSVLFYIKKSKLKQDGTAPVFVRISVNCQRTEFALLRSVDPKLWDSENGKVKGNSYEIKQLNDFIENVSSKIFEIRRNLDEFHKEYTAEDLKKAYLGIVENEEKIPTIGELFTMHNERVKKLVNIDFALGTYERYETCFKHLRDFIMSKYKKDDVPLAKLTPNFIEDFELYLKTVRNCNHNTTVKYLKNFRKIIKIALNNGLEKDPFTNLKFRLDPVDIDFLTEIELQQLHNKKINNERLMNVKNIYLFCCYTGLAFLDVHSLKTEHIALDSSGKKWILKKREKTGVLSRIPILPKAQEILNSYPGYPELHKGRLLPVLSNQKMNAYLKEIADLCGIKKNLSTHTARHTFATTVTLSNKVPIEVVSKMLGHSSIRMTEKYARVVNNYIDESTAHLMVKYAAS